MITPKRFHLWLPLVFTVLTTCDFPAGELIIKNGTDYVVEIMVTAHTDEAGTDTLALNPGQEKEYKWNRTLTEVVVQAQAYEDYDAEVKIGRQSIRGVEIVRDDNRVLTILWEKNSLVWNYKSFGGRVFQ
ncbi:hypothetical protein ACFLT7_00330 [candidate division KSB1 bacterium]